VDVGVWIQHPRFSDLGDVQPEAGSASGALTRELADPLCQQAPVQDPQAVVDLLVGAPSACAVA
jgi:hypothetical protein